MGFPFQVYFAKANLSKYKMLSKIRKSISRYADPLVSPEEALENHIDVVSFDPWASDDNFFKCLQDAEFDTLLCDRSDPPSDEEILLPDLSQRLLTEQADAIDNMFNDYRCLKGSEDGDGFSWPGTRWRQRYPNRYERRANINTKHYEIPAHSQPYDTLRTIYHVRSQPHMIYHTMHLDEKTESLLRSEVIFLVDVIKGRMWDQRQFMFTTFPVGLCYTLAFFRRC